MAEKKIPGEKGYIRISNEADRGAIASLLFKNGYTVSTVRYKRDGKSYMYLVKFELKPYDITEEDLENES